MTTSQMTITLRVDAKLAIRAIRRASLSIYKVYGWRRLFMRGWWSVLLGTKTPNAVAHRSAACGASGAAESSTKPELRRKKMQQTKLGSLIESLINIAIGYGVALLAQVVIFPMYGINVPLSKNLWIGAWFTVISLVRSYVIRRWFNARTSTVQVREELKTPN